MAGVDRDLGVIFFIDAALIVIISYGLPIDAVPGMMLLLRIVTFVVAQIVTNVDLSRRGVWHMLELDLRRFRRGIRV